MKFEYELLLSKKTFYGFDRHSTVPATIVRFRPSVNVGRRAKTKSATRRESCIPIGEARRCLQPRVRDHLAAGVEKETREVTLRNGVHLPTYRARADCENKHSLL